MANDTLISTVSQLLDSKKQFQAYVPKEAISCDIQLDLNMNGEVEINFSKILRKQKKQKYLLFYQGHLVGEILDSNHLTVDITHSAHPVRFSHLKTNKNLSVTSKGDIWLNNILTDFLTVESVTKIVFEKSVRVMWEAIASANIIQTKGKFSGKQITLQANQYCENRGNIFADVELIILAPELHDFGKIRSLGKLSINSKKTDFATTAIVDAEKEFELVGEDLKNAGEVELHGSAVFSLDSIENSGKLHLPAHVYFHSKELKMQAGRMGWFANDTQRSYKKQTLRFITIDKHVRIEASAELCLFSSQFVTDQFEMAGKLDASYSSVTAKTFQATAESSLTAAYSKLNAAFINTYNIVEMTHSLLAGDYITQESGDSKIADHSLIKANVVFRQRNTARSHLSRSAIIAKNINVDGKLLVKEDSLLDSENVDVQGELHLTSSSIQAVKNIGTNRKSIISTQLGATIHVDSIRLDGQSDFTNAYLEAKSFSNNGKSTIKQSHLNVKDSLRSMGKLEIDRATLKAQYVTILGKYDVTELDADTKTFESYGIGTMKLSQLKSEFYSLDEKSKIRIDKSKLSIRYGKVQSNLSVRGSLVSAELINQAQGVWTNNSSDLRVKKAIATEKDSQLILDKSQLISGDEKTSASANFSGEFWVNNANVSMDDLYFDNHTQIHHSHIRAQRNLNLQGSSHKIQGSFLQAKKLSISGNSKLDNKVLIKTETLRVLPHSNVTTHESKLQAVNAHIYGKMSLKRTDVHTKDLAIYDQLKAEASLIEAEDDVELYTSARLQASESALTAENIGFYGNVKAKQAKFSAKKDIHFRYGSRATVDRVSLEAGEEVSVSLSSQINGKNSGIKSKFLTNNGSMNINGLGIDTGILYNNGNIEGGDYLQIYSDLAVLNILGNIRSNDTTINTSFNWNVLGDVCGRDNLNLNAFINLNFLGMLRGYNANINSLLSLNLGLVTPTLSATRKAILSPQHLMSFGKMALINILPSMGNTINLAFQAGSAAYRTGVKVCDIAKSKDKKWSDLLPIHGNPSDWRLAKDVIPAILSIKNLAVTGSHFVGEMNGANSEWQNISWDSVKDGFNQFSRDEIIETVSSVFGSTFSDFSLVNVNAGLLAYQNGIITDIYSANAGVEVGNSLKYTAHNHVNQGVLRNNRLTFTGTNVVNQGDIDSNHMMMRFETVNNHGLGNIHGSNGVVKAEELDNDASIDLSKVKMDVGKVRNHANGSIEVSDAVINFKDAENKAKIIVHQANMHMGELKNHGNGSIEATDAVVKMDEVDNEAKMSVNKSGMQVGHLNNHGKGLVEISDAFFNADKVDNDASIVSEKSAFDANEFHNKPNASTSMTQSEVKVESATLDGKINLNQVSVEAKEQINVSGSMVAKDVVMKAQEYRSSGETQYSGSLVIEADRKLEMAASSEIKAINLDDTFLALKAPNGNLDGKISAVTLALEIENLDDPNGLIANRRGKYFEKINVSKELGLKVNADIDLDQINRNCGLNVEARSVALSTDYKTAYDVRFKSTDGDVRFQSNVSAANVYGDSAANLYVSGNIDAQNQVIFHAKKDFDNYGNISADVISIDAGRIRNFQRSMQGRQIYLEAKETDIQNFGGAIRASEYLQAVANRDITNVCHTNVFNGEYDLIKTFDPAIMQGGIGIDDQRVGLYLKAGGIVLNDASILSSGANLYIEADKGFRSIAESWTYRSYHKVERTWWGRKKEKDEYTTNVGMSGLFAENGGILINAKDGGVYSVATQFVSKDGTNMYAKDNIELYSLKYTDKTFSSTGSFWGLYKTEKTETNESSVPVWISDAGVTRLTSLNGNITGRGVMVVGAGDFYTTAKNGSIIFTADKLSHSLEMNARGLIISLPGLDHLGSFDNNSMLGRVINFGMKADALLHSSGFLYETTNAWNTAMAGYNNYQLLEPLFKDGITLKSILTQNGEGTKLSPTINLTYANTQENLKWQTMGPACIQRKNWYIEAGEEIVIEGVPVDIAENMSVKAQTFSQKSLELEGSTHYIYRSATLGIGSDGIDSVSASYTNGGTNSLTHINQQTHVGGNLNVEVDYWDMAGANVDVSSLSGHVNELQIESMVDIQRSSVLQFASSTNDAFSLSKSHDYSERIRQPTSLMVRKGINVDEKYQFDVVTTRNCGAKIISDGVNNFRSKIIINESISEIEKHTSSGIYFDVNEVKKSIQSFRAGKTSNPVATINIARNSDDLSIFRDATYYGKQGTNVQYQYCTGGINVQNNDAYMQACRSKHKFTLDIPLVDPRKYISKQSEFVMKFINDLKDQDLITKTLALMMGIPQGSSDQKYETTRFGKDITVTRDSDWGKTQSLTIFKKGQGVSRENGMNFSFESLDYPLSKYSDDSEDHESYLWSDLPRQFVMSNAINFSIFAPKQGNQSNQESNNIKHASKQSAKK